MIELRDYQKDVSERVVKEWNKERMSFEKMADGRTASLMALIANVNRGKGTPSFKPQDFLPDYEKEETDELTDAEKLAILMKIHGSN